MVKNGSKACAVTSRGHAAAGVVTVSDTAREDGLTGSRMTAFSARIDQLAAVGHRLARVQGQAHQDLLELAAVGLDVPQPLVAVDLEVDLVAERALQEQLDALDHAPQGEHLGRAGLAAREQQQPPRQLGGAPRGGDDLVDVAGRARAVVELLAHERRVVGDHRQQVVEVVRDAAGELADRLEPLGLAQPRLQPACGA